MGHHIPIPAVDLVERLPANPCESLRLAHRLRSVTLSLPTSDPEVMEALNGAFRRNYMDKYVCFYGLRWMNMDEYD